MNSYDETDALAAQAYARENYERIAKSLPRKLVKKEEVFAARVSAANISSLKKLEMIYGLMDQLSAAVAPYVPCTANCSSCCHINVTVGELEIKFIEKHTGHKRLKVPKEPKDFHGAPCVFLKNGRCSIYKARPFVCRRFTTMAKTSYWCAPERCNDVEFALLGFTDVDAAFHGLRAASGYGEVQDIRQVFGDSA